MGRTSPVVHPKTNTGHIPKRRGIKIPTKMGNVETLVRLLSVVVTFYKGTMDVTPPECVPTLM
jgi:hypothetical protein